MLTTTSTIINQGGGTSSKYLLPQEQTVFQLQNHFGYSTHQPQVTDSALGNQATVLAWVLNLENQSALEIADFPTPSQPVMK